MANRAGPAVAAQPVQSLPPRQLAAQDPERAVLDARAQAIEDALADLRAPAGRAEAEFDQTRAELADLRAGGQKDDDPPSPRAAAHHGPRGMSVRC